MDYKVRIPIRAGDCSSRYGTAAGFRRNKQISYFCIPGGPGTNWCHFPGFTSVEQVKMKLVVERLVMVSRTLVGKDQITQNDVN